MESSYYYVTDITGVTDITEILTLDLALHRMGALLFLYGILFYGPRPFYQKRFFILGHSFLVQWNN